MDRNSEARLLEVHPKLAQKIRTLAESLLQEEIEIRVTQGFRTWAQQHALWLQGRAPVDDVNTCRLNCGMQIIPEHQNRRVTKANNGQSWHNYGLACFDSKTELLTETGWIPFKHYPATMPAAIVYRDGMLSTEIPHGYISYKYSGPMIHVLTRSVDLLTTPNHNFIIKNRSRQSPWRKIRAGRLTDSYKIPTAGDFVFPETIPQYPFIGRIAAEDWWSFMGWYLSEGSACGVSDGIRRQHNNRNKVYIWQSKESSYCPELWNLLTRFPWSPSYKGHGFVIDSIELWKAVFPLGNKYTKRIPRYLLHAPKNLLKKLFDSLVKGDGSFCAGYESYFSANPGLSDDVSELCVRLGISNAISSRIRDRESSIHSTGQIIKPSGRPQYAVLTRRGKTQELRDGNGRTRIRTEDYEGEVFCVTTNAGALVVRREGKVSICGNCDVAPFRNGNPIWDEKDPVWARIITAGEALGLRSGTSWGDEPHFELTGKWGPVPGPEVIQLYQDANVGGSGTQAVWDAAEIA